MSRTKIVPPIAFPRQVHGVRTSTPYMITPISSRASPMMVTKGVSIQQLRKPALQTLKAQQNLANSCTQLLVIVAAHPACTNCLRQTIPPCTTNMCSILLAPLNETCALPLHVHEAQARKDHVEKHTCVCLDYPRVGASVLGGPLCPRAASCWVTLAARLWAASVCHPPWLEIQCPLRNLHSKKHCNTTTVPG